MQRVLYYAAAVIVAVTILVGGVFTFGLGLIVAPAIPAFLPYGREQRALTSNAWARMHDPDVKGMQQAEAQEAMEAIAWRHYDCSGDRDVYLFGSKDPDYLDMVFLNYDSNGNPLETEYYLGWDLQGENRRVEQFVGGCRVVYSK